MDGRVGKAGWVKGRGACEVGRVCGRGGGGSEGGGVAGRGTGGGGLDIMSERVGTLTGIGVLLGIDILVAVSSGDLPLRELMLLQQESHNCCPFTSTSLSFRCFPQYEMGHTLQNTKDLLLQMVQ